MFSLAGIPPLLGFYSKFVVFQAVVDADLVVFAAIAIAASVIGAFYYIKFVKVMFFDEPADLATGKSEVSHWVLLAITAAIISPLGYLLTGSLSDLANKACSRVWPWAAFWASKPASNSPRVALTTNTATSACDAPLIMFGIKSLWPGASNNVIT